MPRLRTLPPLLVVLIVTLCAWLPFKALASEAFAGAHVEPVPFTAHYRLEISGWPNTNVEHRLTQHGEQWQSDMRAAIAVASGNERSRFRVNAESVRPSAYSSGYSLFGIGDRYQLGSAELSELPDRQTALFDLSRRATLTGDCTGHDTPPCELDFLDHKGEEEALRYQIIEHGEIDSPAGTFEAITVATWDPQKPERQLVFHFHPELPGLLLGADYHRDGEHRSRLTLRAVDIFR